MVSLWRELFCKHSFYNLKSDRWVTKFFNKICVENPILQSIQNSKSVTTLNAGTSELIQKRSKILQTNKQTNKKVRGMCKLYIELGELCISLSLN